MRGIKGHHPLAHDVDHASLESWQVLPNFSLVLGLSSAFDFLVSRKHSVLPCFCSPSESFNVTTTNSIPSPSSAPPWGANPEGILLYTADNHMSVQIVECEGDLTFSTNDPRGGTKDELAGCMKRFTGYSGSFSIRVAAHGELLLEHHVDVCSFPNWTGSVQRRIMELDGNLLLLRTEDPILIEASISPLLFHRYPRCVEVTYLVSNFDT